MLFQNDSYGKDLLAGLKQGIARSKVKVVAAQPYEVTASDIQSEMAQLQVLRGERARAVRDPEVRDAGLRVREPAGLAAADHQQRRLERLEHHDVASEGGTNKAVENSVSIVFLKDPTDAKWRNDAAMKLYRTIMARYARARTSRTSSTSTAWPSPTRRSGAEGGGEDA